jgi:CRP/FNR family cyclic AMP-dependent transcriptional regulator
MRVRERDEVMAILQGLPLFASLTRRQLRAVAQECTTAHYEPGEVILKELDDGQHLVVIVEGEASVVRSDTPIATVGPGDAVGEMSVIDREPRSASVIAGTAVEGLVIYGTAFRELLDDYPTLVRRLLLAQTARLRELDRRTALHG